MLGRVAVLLWLVGQTAGAVLAPVADALTGHGVEVVAHVEDDAGTHCPPTHSEVGCHLAVVTIASIGSDPVAVEGGARWSIVRARPQAWDEAPPVGAARALPLGRGPPRA